MSGIFELYVKTHFAAAHSLKEYPGDCARIHGHNWAIEVFVRCKDLNELGIGVDFKDIKEGIERVLSSLDHFNLNELPAFQDINPTSENLAKYLYITLGQNLNSDTVKISKVKVSETPEAGAFYWEE